MPDIATMSFNKVYSALIAKAERKGRSKEEINEIPAWLTGYAQKQLEEFMNSDLTYGEFINNCPNYNPRSELIKGKVCGIRVEEIEDPFMKRVRQLDKLIDELAKGKKMEEILR